MSPFTRKVIGVLLFLLIIGIAVGVLGHRLLVKSLPDYQHDIRMPALEAPVKVLWTAQRVPHVFARNSRDLFRMAGYVAAQERLWQMDLTRRAALGRLSEIFGEETMQSDIFFRTWGLDRIADRIVQQLSTASREVLALYAEGVNAFIRSHQDRLPVEFALLGYKPDPWHIRDSIAISRLMAFQLSFTWHLELTLHAIAERVGTSMALELFPEFPADASVIVADRPAPPASLFAETLQNVRAATRALGGSGTLSGSNSWVIGGGKSASGKPILANDPHLDLRIPSVWYEMHLAGGEYNVAGVTFPGIPGVVIGHNSAAAWGLTNAMLDDADFYFEQLDPQTGETYRDGNGWQDVQFVREKIEIKGSDEPRFLDVRLTARGPIISPLHPLYAQDSTAISVRWTGQKATDEVAAILALNKAQNWDDFLAAVQQFQVPAQNFIYADCTGTIGYALAGAIPIRRDGKGFLPYAGRERKGDWIGEVGFRKLPKLRNPKKAFIATANNRIATKSFPYYLGNGWEPDSRIHRIEALLASQSTFSVADFQRMHRDVRSYHAEKCLKIILPVLQKATLTDTGTRILSLLQDWDFREDVESAPATVWNYLFVRLLHNTLEDEVGSEILDDFLYWTNFPIRAMENLLTLPRSRWWDDVRTPEQEKMADILVRSYSEALAILEKEMGDGPGYWDWGRVHQVKFTHPIGRKAPFGRLFNVGPYPIGGSASTIAKAEFRFFKPFAVDAGASMRQIVDLADPSVAYTIIAGGQSGQPYSDFYADQIPMWLSGQYKQVRLLSSAASLPQSKVQLFRPEPDN